MVYDTKTLEPLHGLTEQGIVSYQMLLGRKADEILFKHKHPIRYWFQRLRNWIKTGDSEWLGPDFSKDEKYKDGFEYSSQD